VSKPSPRRQARLAARRERPPARLRPGLLALAVWFAAGSALAEDVQVRVAAQKPPYYIGDPVVLQFTVTGFDEAPDPSCEIVPEEPLPGIRGRITGVSPRVSSYMVQRNGRVFQSKTVTLRIDYMVTADRPGEYQVGPFLIRQGNKQARVDALPMVFEDVPQDPEMRIRLVLPDRPLYPDERVPVKIEWWYAGNMDNILNLNIHSPLFDQFRFAPDAEWNRRSSRLPILTASGRVALAAEVRQEELEGRTYLVATAERTLIPERVGRFTLEPITATLRAATAWERQRSPFDDFGGSLFRDLMGENRRPSRTTLTRAIGEPLALLVNPFPLDGRPESFAGAVGSGFSIDVAADRTVVRVGDPIDLAITLHGDGNLAGASLPPLSADGGMDPDRFRLPEGETPGTVVDDAKTFRVSVRVSDESVAEIPALAYSWFDPEEAAYKTARSKPIALRVMPAQVISAADVVRRTDSPATALADAGDEEQPAPGAAAAAGESRFSLSGADLAIERDPAVVLRDQRGGGRTGLQLALYAAGLALIAAAIADRRRRARDPAVAAVRKNVRRQRARIAAAADLPKQKAAEQIAAALRALVADLPDVARGQTQSLIAECESIVYAPVQDGAAALDAALVARAGELAERFRRAARRLPALKGSAMGTTRRITAGLGVFWLCLGWPALAAGGQPASPAELLEQAVAAYRAALDAADREVRLAEFRRAELLFARLVGEDQPGRLEGIRNADLYVNLGNAALGAERLGPAILAYRRALALDADHHRARQNLDHARTLLPEWVPRPEEGGLLDTFFSWSRRISPHGLKTLSAGAFLVAAAILAASIRWRQPVLRSLALMPLAAWLVFLGVLAFRWSAADERVAVVVLPEAVARSADSAGAPPRLPQPLPGGSELRVVETRQEWARVRLYDGRDAWVPQSAIGLVANHH
jgi:tetratricopeptide (TPR) repeat protein